jgi:hypothetical protein
MYVMRRTTVFLDEQTLARARRHAQRTGVSFATLVREALAAYLTQPIGGSLPSVAGRFGSGRRDTSERVDELLWRDPHE